MSHHTRMTLRTLGRAGLSALALVALTAPLASARALAPGPAAGKVLGGLTSQGWPVVLKVSGNAKSIQRVRIGLEMNCTSGASFSVPDGWIRVPILRGGQVDASAAVSPSPASGGSDVSITGGTDSFSGTLNRSSGTFSGTWHQHVDFATSGGQSDSCDSGNVTFTASL